MKNFYCSQTTKLIFKTELRGSFLELYWNGNVKWTERESQGVGQDMGISPQLFLEVLIKWNSNFLRNCLKVKNAEYYNGDSTPRQLTDPLFFLDTIE